MRPGCTHCEFSSLVDSLCDREGKEPCPHCNGRCGAKEEKKPVIEIVLPKITRRRKGQPDAPSPLVDIILSPTKRQTKRGKSRR